MALRAAFLCPLVLLSMTSHSSGEYLYGREAAGQFRHVAGSACCHPQAETLPVSSPSACERRCSAAGECDAFVYTPTMGLCFLIRYTARVSSSVGAPPLETPSRAAPDRIFGVVARGQGESSKSKRRTKSSSSTRKAKRKSSKRRKQTKEEQEAFKAFRSFFGGSDEGDCDSCGGVEFVLDADCECVDCSCADGVSMEELLRQAGWHGHRFDEHTQRKATGSRSKHWSSMGSHRHEECSASCSEDSFSTCQGHAEEQWKNRFKQARAYLWPDSDACSKECTKECRNDLHESKEEVTELLKKIARELLGEDGATAEDVFIIESDFAEDDDEAVCSQVCEDVCGGLADDAVNYQEYPHMNFTRKDNDSCGHADDGKDHRAVQLVVDVLRGAFEQAGAQLQKMAPQLLDSAAPGFLETLALRGTSDFGSIGELVPSVTGKLLDSEAQVYDWSEDWSAPSSTPATALSPSLAAKGGITLGAIQQLRTANLLPSSSTLFQGLPAASRWADGSPNFFDQLFGRALSRLGLPAMSLKGPL